MKNIKRMLCVLLSLTLMLGLWACSTPNTDSSSQETLPKEPPELIYGQWYPMPDVSEEPVEIKADKTCVINGRQWNWVTKTIEEDLVVLTVGEGEEEFEIEFKYLTSNIPVLADRYSGWSLKNPELWDYMGEWYNEDTKNTFSLSLFAMKEANCKIELKAGTLIVETPDGHTLNVTTKQCVVTDKDGNNIVYTPLMP